MENLFDTRPERPGYRLQRLEVFNWGTFDSQAGQVYRFEPDGRTSLLVGHNGSGKSTLVDAILTLLVDSRTRNYNVAAGAKKRERTPKSYIKGAFDRTADETQSSVVQYLRPKGDHITAIYGTFRDEQLEKSFTLAQVLYLKGDGSDDKVYAIADGERELKEDLAGLQQSDQVLSHLKDQDYRTTRAYVEYQGWLRKRTKMRGKAIDMFNQTVAVKDIQSLNVFIRSHMLEAFEWREKVDRLLKHFSDLSLAYQELVRARRREELLRPVATAGEKYQQLAAELERLEQLIAAARTFFPLQTIQLFEPEIASQETMVEGMAVTIKRLDGSLESTRETVRQLTNEIEQAGGERLKHIPGLIQVEETHVLHKKQAFDRYHECLRLCQIQGSVVNEERFRQARGHLQKVAESTAEPVRKLKERRDETAAQKGVVNNHLREERTELDALQRRRGNLPSHLTTMRCRICEDLQLDESVLPFVAELVAVRPDEQKWEASIEMVLRQLAMNLLVPERFYRRVRAYVEQTRMTNSRGEGQRLDYTCVTRATEQQGDQIPAQSLYEKLQFRDGHDLTPWVRGEIIRRCNYRCCENIEEFNTVERMAMTTNRHVKYTAGRHQKDDRERTVNPRHFVLGWDNTQKKRRIADRIKELEAELKQLTSAISSCDVQIESQQITHRAAVEALDVNDFESINVRRHESNIEALRKEKQQLEESNDVVRMLRKRLTEVNTEVKRLNDERDDKLQSKATLEAEIQHVRRLVDKSRSEVTSAKQNGDFEHHETMFDAISESLGDSPLTIETLEPRRSSWEATTRQQIDDRRGPLQKVVENLVGAMSRFLKEFKEEQDDLDEAVDSLPSFLFILDQLRREDLPRHEKRFKDRLNDQVSQEVALFNAELRQESKQIEERIAQLNKALSGVEYNPGTSMQLEPRKVQDREIEEFRRSLKECLDDSLEQTDEANHVRFLRIQALVDRLSDKDKTTWRNKVIDVRNWYDFAAQEVDRDTQAKLSCYDGSSGQSGGEKAKLAFTILVAALAYQFDVDPDGKTPGRFQFVVVDEMFSKVDDQNAQFALRLFQQFGLQLLIVAPLDAKARITEPFVNRYALAQKDQATNRSQLFSMTAQEYEEVVKQLSTNGSTRSKRKPIAK